MSMTHANAERSAVVIAPPRTLLLVGPLPPPAGGMANQMRQLAALLTAEGCAVRVARNNAPYRPAWVGPLRGVRALFRLLPYVFDLWRSMRGVDVVHVFANSGWAWHFYAAPAVWIAVLRGKPVIVNYRGGEAASFFARGIAFVGPTMKRASAIVVPSGFLQEVFARHGIETTIVPNVVDLDAFHPSLTPVTSFHALVTRNLEPIYDIATALRAFARVVTTIPDARMTVAGSGPDADSLARLAKELGIADRVRFTGRIDNAELPDLYRTASVALNSSLADNMPISILEAWASGIPVVSTRVGGVPHLVDEGTTALLVDPKDASAMAEAMLRIHAEPTLSRGLAEAGRWAVAQYAWPVVRGRWFAAYDSAQNANAPLVRDTRFTH